MQKPSSKRRLKFRVVTSVKTVSDRRIALHISQKIICPPLPRPCQVRQVVSDESSSCMAAVSIAPAIAGGLLPNRKSPSPDFCWEKVWSHGPSTYWQNAGGVWSRGSWLMWLEKMVRMTRSRTAGTQKGNKCTGPLSCWSGEPGMPMKQVVATLNPAISSKGPMPVARATMRLFRPFAAGPRRWPWPALRLAALKHSADAQATSQLGGCGRCRPDDRGAASCLRSCPGWRGSPGSASQSEPSAGSLGGKS